MNAQCLTTTSAHNGQALLPWRASLYNTFGQGQMDEHDRQDLLRALMLVKTAHDFEQLAQLLDVKNELQNLTRMNNI